LQFCGIDPKPLASVKDATVRKRVEDIVPQQSICKNKALKGRQHPQGVRRLIWSLEIDIKFGCRDVSGVDKGFGSEA
jgi:hypothetical protein